MHVRFLILIIIFLVSACQRAFPLPELGERVIFSNFPNHREQRSIAFEGALIDLPRGETYIAHPYWRFSFDKLNISLLEACNVSVKYRLANSTLDWATGEKKFGNWESSAAQFVNGALSKIGYDVVDASTTLFHRERLKRRAELLLSGKITDIKANVCNLLNLMYYKEENVAAGNAYIKVEWEVFDTLADKVIATFTSEGIGYVERPTGNGSEMILLRALEDAADRLGHQPAFYRLLTRKNVLDELVKSEEKQSIIRLKSLYKRHTQPLNEHFYTLKRSVVTVGDEGTGFFITPHGDILTSLQAVGEADFIVVEDAQGVRHRAKVIRTNGRLGIVLLKVNLEKTTFLPIADEKLAKALEQVFTIGNPNEFKARSTITQGTISALRVRKKQAQNFIQASIPTIAGFAGAPLLDAYGNVLGIHDGRNTSETNFSYFIPIHDVLRALNIQLIDDDDSQSI